MLALRITSNSLRNAVAMLLAVGIAPWFVPYPATAQDDLQPYTVYVDQEQVMARCGPGGDFYRTDELRHGQALEVYVETADHWLGIRPPDGSFSWLPADAVTLAPSKGFATVKEDHTIAWIGTHLGQASKYLWQVELSKGEEVAIIGRAKREGPEGVKVWYRIVPPAGEFRWVHRDQVVDSPELLLRDKDPAPRVARKSNAAVRPATFSSADDESTDNEVDSSNRASRTNQDDSESDEPAKLRPLPRPEPDVVPLEPLRKESTRNQVSQAMTPREQGESNEQHYNGEPAVAPEQPIGSGVVRAQATQPRGSQPTNPAREEAIARSQNALQVGFTTSPRIVNIGEAQPPAPTPVSELTDSFGSRNAPRNQITQGQPSPHQDARVVPATAVSNTALPAHSVPAQPLNSFTAVQNELSRLMASSASAQEMQLVIDSANELISGATTEPQRDQCLKLIERARQYQQIAQRRSAQNGSLNAVPTAYPEPIQTDELARSGSEPAAPSENAVSGYLVQVFSSRPDSPPFALTDSQGRTIHYLSASPGVNLRRYLNQHVTVRGATGYSTGLDTPHMIATSAMRTVEPTP